MSTHNGKIGRLPSALRDQLNQRLTDGETATTLLPWLNSQPATLALLADRFNGEPVSEQNLSQWRKGGYVQWQKNRERRAIVEELAEADGELGTPEAEYETELSQRLARVLTADFAVATRDLLADLADPAERCRKLQEFLLTLKFQRRENYLTERLKIEMERRARERLDEADRDDYVRENAPWLRQIHRGELDKLFQSFDFTSQAKAVQAGETLLRSMQQHPPNPSGTPPKP